MALRCFGRIKENTEDKDGLSGWEDVAGSLTSCVGAAFGCGADAAGISGMSCITEGIVSVVGTTGATSGMVETPGTETGMETGLGFVASDGDAGRIGTDAGIDAVTGSETVGTASVAGATGTEAGIKAGIDASEAGIEGIEGIEGVESEAGTD